MLHLIDSSKSVLLRKYFLSLLIVSCAIVFCACPVSASGTLDPTFGNNGEVKLSIPVSPLLASLQADGKIVVVSGPPDSESGYDFGIARYNSNGSLDVTFGRHGQVFGDLTPSSDLIMAMAFQPDGKIVLGGRIVTSLSPYNSDMILVRYNANGRLDETFGNGGFVITDLSVKEEIHAIAVQPDGKIVVTGGANVTTGEGCGYRFLVGRFDNHGVLDQSFGTGGITYTPFGDCGGNNNSFEPQFNSVSITSDGKIITGGTVRTYYQNYVIAQFNNNGTQEFFKSYTSFQDYSVGFRFITKLPDGKILAIGEKVARFLSNGDLDPSFPMNEQIVMRTNFSHGTGALLPDGKILWFASYNPLSTSVDYVRVLSRNGGVLGEIRKVVLSPRISSVLAQADGKIIVLSDVMRRHLNISSMAGRQTDFDGDFKTDIGFYRPSDGTWAIQTNVGQGDVSYAIFGQPGDYPTPGKFFGSIVGGVYSIGNRSQVAVYRPSTGVWYINQMCGDQGCYRVLGGPGYVPISGDYDGDGRDDYAVFKDGEWRVSMSFDSTQRISHWGQAGDQAVPGDYDFDGFTDLAVYRPSNGTWYVSLSSNGDSLIQEFGDINDRPVPGDYDGDGRTDFAVFRSSNGTWYIRNSRDSSLTVQHFGLSTDRPVPGDYDGDGRTDIGVFRNGVWYLLRSSAGLNVVEWGAADTVPLTPGYSAN